MVQDIIKSFPKHTPVKVRKLVKWPVVGWIWLPLWMDFEWEFISRKGTRYTLHGMAYKLACKCRKQAQIKFKTAKPL